MRRVLGWGVALGILMVAAPSDARAEGEGVVCHSEVGACRVEQEEGSDMTAFECTCRDGSTSEGELESHPDGLAFACVSSLGVCGEAPTAFVGGRVIAPSDVDDSIPEDLEDDATAAGCSVGAPANVWLGALFLPLLWRRRRT